MMKEGSAGGGRGGASASLLGSTSLLGSATAASWIAEQSLLSSTGEVRVQTASVLEAKSEAQAALLRAMLDKISKVGGTATGSSEAMSLARRAAEPPPSAVAEREVCTREQLFPFRRAPLFEFAVARQVGSSPVRPALPLACPLAVPPLCL